MKLLSWLIGLFVPRETNPENSDPGVDPGADPKPTGGSDPDGKPDWLPDKFYDPDVGPRVELLAKSFRELEGKLSQKKENLAEELKSERLASAPEKYEIALPEDLNVPEGVEVTLKEDDPVAEWFMGFAKENGLSQEEFNAAVNTYIQLEISKLPDVNAEIEKLGDYGQDRLLKVDTHLKNALDEEEYAAIQPMMTSAKGIEAMEKLIKQAGPGQFDGDGGGEGLTLNELRKMQNDPRYYRDQDPAFIERVKKGYERLYKR